MVPSMVFAETITLTVFAALIGQLRGNFNISGTRSLLYD